VTDPEDATYYYLYKQYCYNITSTARYPTLSIHTETRSQPSTTHSHTVGCTLSATRPRCETILRTDSSLIRSESSDAIILVSLLKIQYSLSARRHTIRCLYLLVRACFETPAAPSVFYAAFDARVLILPSSHRLATETSPVPCQRSFPSHEVCQRPFRPLLYLRIDSWFRSCLILAGQARP